MQDNGQGIAPALHSRALERFYRLPEARGKAAAWVCRLSRRSLDGMGHDWNCTRPMAVASGLVCSLQPPDGNNSYQNYVLKPTAKHPG